MLSKEDVIPLAMEGGHSSSMELRVLREESSQHPGNRVSQPGGEVVEDDLWLVICSSAMALDVIATGELCKLEICCRSLREMYQPKPI